MKWIIAGLLYITQISIAQPVHQIKPGEELSYSAWFNFIRGGESSLQLVGTEEINGISVYHIRSKTESLPFFDRIYKVRDYMDSWIDTSGRFSYRFTKSLREGKYRKKYLVNFDYRKKMAISDKQTILSSTPVYDGLSLFYYVRMLDLKIGETFKINYFDNDSLHPFILQVDKTEVIKTPLGDIECFVLAPYLESGRRLKNNSHLTIYLSTDERRIPVMISNKARFGELILKLESIKIAN